MGRKSYMRRSKIERYKHNKETLLNIIRVHGKKADGHLVISFGELIEHYHTGRHSLYSVLPNILELCRELEKANKLKILH